MFWVSEDRCKDGSEPLGRIVYENTELVAEAEGWARTVPIEIARPLPEHLLAGDRDDENTIRHCLTNYEQLLANLENFGERGSPLRARVYGIIRERVNDLIKDTELEQ
jgi:hypothetical protein